MKKINQMLFTGLILTLSGMASATQISGDIIFGGDVSFDFTANSVDILGDDAIVTATPTGDFGAYVSLADTAVYNDFNYDPYSVVSPLWTVGGFSFTLNAIDHVEELTIADHRWLNLGGSGVFSGNGYDVTRGLWTFSADGTNGGNFAFSSVNVPEPAVILLLSAGLIGFSVARKLRDAA